MTLVVIVSLLLSPALFLLLEQALARSQDRP